MELLTSILIGVGLAMDAFTVSLGIGTARQASDQRAKFRLAFHFGFFQMAMTVVGWFAGSSIAAFIEAFDHWVAMGLLAYVGGNMIRSGFNPEIQGRCSINHRFNRGSARIQKNLVSLNTVRGILPLRFCVILNFLFRQGNSYAHCCKAGHLHPNKRYTEFIAPAAH